MQWSYHHNPDMEYGVEMLPSKENYESSLPKHEDYRSKSNVDFGFIEIFALIMLIPSWVFIYNFFYLLVLPLIPVSVVVFELVREIAPLNQLMMYGSSFFSAYLFYKGLKYLFKLLSFIEGILLFVALYGLATFWVYFLVDFYPQNEALNGAIFEIKEIVDLIKSTI